MPQKIRAHVFISGKVQGVNFRWNTKRKAKKQELTGWVKNLPDGRVEVVLEGEKENVEQMIGWIKKGGPSFAKVKNLEVSKGDYRGEFKDFEIRY